jgi:hypothetical protein
MSYSDDISIDQFALDKEMLKQAKLVKEYGEKWAEAVYEKDRAKNRLELHKAEKNLHIRQFPKDYGFSTKPNEDAIKNLVTVDAKTQELQRVFDNKQKLVNKLITAKAAFSQKGYDLSNLAELWKSNYWADPGRKVDTDSLASDMGKRAILKNLNMKPRLLQRRKNGEKE